MARAFPQSRFTGFDYHPPSIATASKAAAEAGVGDRVAFEVAAADAFPGSGYDLVCLFDCLHDMGDPVAAAAHIRKVLDERGTVLLVEAMAGHRITDNLHPIDAWSTRSRLSCAPRGRAGRTVRCRWALRQAKLASPEVLTDAGFTQVRRAAETPFNLVLEARP